MVPTLHVSIKKSTSCRVCDGNSHVNVAKNGQKQKHVDSKLLLHKMDAKRGKTVLTQVDVGFDWLSNWREMVTIYSTANHS